MVEDFEVDSALVDFFVEFSHGRPGTCWREDPCSFSGQVPRLQQVGLPEDTTCSQGSAGLAQVGAPSLSGASGTCFVDSSVCSALCEGGAFDGGLCPPFSGVLPPTERGFAFAEERPRCPIRLFDVLGFGVEPGGGGRPVQDLGV